MSRTHKTAPVAVKMAQGHLNWEEVHNHERGPCDLVPIGTRNAFTFWPYNTNRCYRLWKWEGRRICGCDRCSFEPDESRKARRARERRETRNWDRDY